MDVTRGWTGTTVPSTVLCLLSGLVPHDPVDAGHAGHAVLVTDSLCQQPVSDLPGEHGWVLLLVFADGVHHWRGGNLGFAASDDPRLEVARLIISGEYLGDTAVGHSELSADITRSDSLVGEFYNPLSDHVREGTAVDEEPTKLVDSTMACKKKSVISVVRKVDILS